MAEETLELAAQQGHATAIRFIRADVSLESAVEATIARAFESFGRLDCMFNNAGVAGAMGPITETTVEEWDHTQGLLLRSVFLGIKHGGRALRSQGRGGSIINTASTGGLGGGPAAYSAAKSGVVNLARCAVVELGRADTRQYHRTRWHFDAIDPG
ncbi:SDR family oxidoreductase [Paraburkholderia tropica]|uniref:SDR family oxidoreductase n=1 Tax=Paraburkholderia tropica TaxID=92647 RepID=UPI002AB6C482|nr:SDR family oxidoreductase [Paraburkholderia tropica]